ncbi:hypothetical protein HNS38_08200 [Lentimicrobium sp. L6]|uniref:hypothetical protein n=1 Tax=Lentimicrobium sp. L6 TaxID=2735916 RepID=UPI001C12F9FB|nr:hypothetical protein [Lentimicrobium sp. L6]NPD46968.1 hypothetical protein [Lentimicrobium sp. S6]NPD84734.1 hypothetical protein [Lentimicrobium sp. L6]
MYLSQEFWNLGSTGKSHAFVSPQISNDLGLVNSLKVINTDYQQSVALLNSVGRNNP